MLSNQKFVSVGLLAFAIILVSGVAMAAVTSDSETSTVDITVANKTLIDINPASVPWNVNPGNYTAVNESFDIENVGSKPIDKITASITPMPTENPYGSGSASNYTAGNFLVLEVDNSAATADPTNTDASTYHFIQHREFNESSDNPRYLTQADPSTGFEGRFRVDDQEFFWEVEPGTNNVWGNGTLYVSDTAHNKTETGDVDLSDNTGYALTEISSTEGYVDGLSLTTDGTAENYCVLVNASASPAYVELQKFTSFATTNCASSGQYVKDPSNADLEPGQSKGMNLAARVAFGVKEGVLQQGNLQITATSAY